MPDEPSGVAAVVAVAALATFFAVGAFLGLFELATWLLP